MDTKFIVNNIYKGRKVCEIAQEGLKNNEDKILLFREMINSYPECKWEEIGENKTLDLLILLESQTDHILKGQDRDGLTGDEKEKQDLDEDRILSFYASDIKELFQTLSKVDF